MAGLDVGSACLVGRKLDGSGFGGLHFGRIFSEIPLELVGINDAHHGVGQTCRNRNRRSLVLADAELRHSIIIRTVETFLAFGAISSLKLVGAYGEILSRVEIGE